MREFAPASRTVLPEPDATGKRWWRSLDELARTPEFREYLYREFPRNADAWLAGSRRDFLRLMAASFALAGLGGCGSDSPPEKIVPAVRQAGHLPPGSEEYFTTAMELGGVPLGLVVRSRDGRPIKIEGNRRHPGSRGATHVFAQAATLSLYDPDRLTTILHKGQISSKDELRRSLITIQSRLDRVGGAGLWIVLPCSTSPTLQRLLGQLGNRWPDARWCVYEPAVPGPSHGDAGRNHAVYAFDRARVVVSLDCDFLAARDRPLNELNDYISVRRMAARPEGAPPATEWMVRHYHLEPTPTLTGAKADHRLILSPATLESTVTELARRLGVLDSPASAALNKATTPEIGEWLDAVVQDLQDNQDAAVVAIGDHLPPRLHRLAAAINASIGAVGNTVNHRPSAVIPPSAGVSPGAAGLQQLTEAVAEGRTEAVLVLGGNPAFDAPADIPFAESLPKVPFTLALVPEPNETARLCEWAVPESHFLEAWGDVRSPLGVASIVQPLIRPLYESLSRIELLQELLGDEVNGLAAVRETWRQQWGDESFESSWQQALRLGVIETPQSDESEPPPAEPDFLRDDSDADTPATAAPQAWTVLFRPDPTIHDGRFANNGWLQELPKPLSKLTWDNPAWISHDDARELGLENGDEIRLTAGDRSVTLPVWIVPGQPRHCVTLYFGYGRREVGRVGQGTGFDVYPLRTSDALWTREDVQLEATGGRTLLASTQHHFLMEGRHLARSGTREEYLADPEHPGFVHPPEPHVEASFYDEWPYEGHRWGMAIDLTACTGCTACVIACQAENNIPVVGKEEVARNREMHWIRIDTWHEGDEANPRQTLHQPVTCMHCEKAPCEVVCPVAATTHSDDGLNQMIYNRCVGTRYCSNNCPYKVRRFNFLDYSDSFVSEPVLELLSNPEVSIRERGVMEKCTFCVQRIESARIAAGKEGRPIRTGEVVTACQAVCPAQAIHFGDLNDPDSTVHALREHPLSYGLLAHLNTQPRTTYLAEVTNR